MSLGPEDRRAPMTPQLARRVAIVGTFALAMFGIIFFRLWFLQILSGDQYVKAATGNRVRDIAIAAPRGMILDSSGTTLVDSTRALALQISPLDLPAPVSLTDLATIEHPPRQDAVLYNRLAHVVGMSTKPSRCRLHLNPPNVFRLSPIACAVGQQVSLLPYANATIKTGSVVSKYVQYYLAERQNQFPGVQVQQVYVTHYPYATLAAQVLGTVGPINTAELAQPAYRSVSPNSIIGQSGLEAQYDSFLRGKDGYQQVQINSLGQPTGNLHTQAPVQGHNLKLSLNADLQRVGERALATSIASNSGADAGSFVAMNPTNGEVYAMGSYPTFDPSIFTRPLSQAKYQSLVNPADGAPLLNRATQSFGPTGSTFKPITATAALQSGLWNVGDSFDDTGQYCFSGQCRQNAGGASYGSLDLVNAIRVSSDNFFYHLGVLTNADPTTHPRGGPLDQWARAFGIGRRTGVDLGGELPGTLPSPMWRAQIDKVEAQCERKQHVPSCGIADGRLWSAGDNENLAVGQGDVQVSPLQLAVVYAALANGGTIVRPHLGLDVQSNDGTVLQTINPPPSGHVNINPLYLDTIRQGLRDAASQQGGTSADVFGNFPEPVYGKTGTAQYTNQPDYAWYACFVPATATSKPIVVVVHVERGGFGDVAAAPVARQILSQWFLGKPGTYTSGSSKTL